MEMHNIPAEIPSGSVLDHMLRSRRWLVWKHDKQPFYADGTPRRGMLDSPEDQARLVSYAEAKEARIRGGFAGLGFALGPDGSGGYWQGIDLDDIPGRQLADLANALPGYVERSPSGTGAHAIGYGQAFDPLTSNGTGIEAYSRGRYFTFTGHVLRFGELCSLAPFVVDRLLPVHSVGREAASAFEVEQVDAATVTDLRSALSAIRSDDRDVWVSVGIALKTLGEVGRGLWLEWSQTSDKWKPGDARQWDTFKPTRTGYAAVFAKAQERGWVNPNSNAARVPDRTVQAELDRWEADTGEGFSIPTPKLRREAYYGILGEVAWAGSANTEAVPAALAINTLARFCATLGNAPYIAIGDDRRALRPFAIIAGPTGKGRKGYSAKLPERIYSLVDQRLGCPLRCETSASSGEGLVWMVRDEKRVFVDGKEVVEDPGIIDKRVLLEVSEFAGVLAQAKRETSVLTSTLRDAWDGRRLSTPNKNNPCFASNPHFVVLGHITREELTKLLTNTDIKNGFANRFMMVYSARPKIVDDPLETPDYLVEAFAKRIEMAVRTAWMRHSAPVQLSDAAKPRWAQIRRELEGRTRTGDVMSLMARADTYVRILAAAIALINQEQVVEPAHLNAALAWVDHWEETANFCFTAAAQYDEMEQVKTVADEIVAALESLGGKDVPRSAINNEVTNRGKRKDRKALFEKAITALQNEAPPRIVVTVKKGAGRPTNLFSLA